jgi:NAD(P)H-nitrite reductase large subunit
MTECFGAGTGCGWCRPMLERLFHAAQGQSAADPEPSASQYARGRAAYVRAGGGTPPPGATPIDDAPQDGAG